MAKADFKLPDEFLTKLSRLGKDTDSVAEKVLEVGGQVVLAKVRSNLAAVIGSGTKYDSRSTGELAQSLGLSRSAFPNRARMAAATQRSPTSSNTENPASRPSLF